MYWKFKCRRNWKWKNTKTIVITEISEWKKLDKRLRNVAILETSIRGFHCKTYFRKYEKRYTFFIGEFSVALKNMFYVGKSKINFSIFYVQAKQHKFSFFFSSSLNTWIYFRFGYFFHYFEHKVLILLRFTYKLIIEFRNQSISSSRPEDESEIFSDPVFCSLIAKYENSEIMLFFRVFWQNGWS